MKKRPESAWRAMLRGNVGALALVSLFNDVASEMVYPLLPLFLTQSLGATALFVGVLEGIADSASSLLKMAGGIASDRLGRRKALAAWGYTLATATRPVLALAAAPWHVLALRLTDRVGKGMRSAPRDALLAASVEPERRGLAFGLHRGADHLGAVIGPLLAALVLVFAPGDLRLVFVLATIPGAVGVWIVWRHVREHAPAAAVRGARALPPIRALGGRFGRYLGVLLLFTLGNASDAFLLLLAEMRGVPTAALPLLWAALHVSKSLWSVPGGWLADRWPAARVVVAGWAVYAGVYAGFAAADAAWHIWALFGLYGAFYGLTEAPQKALVANLAPEALHGRAFGAYHLATGLGALPASVLFGALWSAYGAPVAFGVGAALAGLAALLLVPALGRGRG